MKFEFRSAPEFGDSLARAWDSLMELVLNMVKVALGGRKEVPPGFP